MYFLIFKYFCTWKTLFSFVKENDVPTPYPFPQKWRNWVIGPIICAMLWNVCKTIFRFVLNFFIEMNFHFKFLGLLKNIFLLRFRSYSDLHMFQKIVRKIIPKKNFDNFFFRMFWNVCFESKLDQNRSKKIIFFKFVEFLFCMPTFQMILRIFFFVEKKIPATFGGRGEEGDSENHSVRKARNIFFNLSLINLIWMWYLLIWMWPF